jgi:hypothetical protein
MVFQNQVGTPPAAAIPVKWRTQSTEGLSTKWIHETFVVNAVSTSCIGNGLGYRQQLKSNVWN